MIIKKEFAPVTIILESKEELDELKSILFELQRRSRCLGWGGNKQDKYDDIAQAYLDKLK